MSLRHRSLVVTVVLLVVFSFTACNKQEQPPDHPLSLADPQPVAITVGTDGYCLQNGVEGGNAVMGTGGLKWSNPNANATLAIVVNPGAHACPFGSCSFPASSTPISSGRSSANPGDQFTYTSITVNGTPCQPGMDGFIMR